MKRVGTVLKWLVIVVAGLFVIVQLKRPARTNPPREKEYERRRGVFGLMIAPKGVWCVVHHVAPVGVFRN